jgi:hypothetical protein
MAPTTLVVLGLSCLLLGVFVGLQLGKWLHRPIISAQAERIQELARGLNDYLNSPLYQPARPTPSFRSRPRPSRFGRY